MDARQDDQGVKITLRGVRHCFTYLYEQHISKTNGGKTFRDTFLIVPGSEQDKQIRAAISQAAKNAWGDKAQLMVKAFAADRTKFPYRDGSLPDSAGNVNPDLERFWTLTAINRVQPSLWDENNQDISGMSKNGAKLYPGAYVTAIVRFWPQTQRDRAGMRCELQGVRHDRDADRIGVGGRRASVDEFGPPPGNPDADADLIGGNPDSDDIPF